MAGGCGPCRMTATAQHFNSRCRLVAKKNRLCNEMLRAVLKRKVFE
jgi:hypothetical protein